MDFAGRLQHPQVTRYTYEFVISREITAFRRIFGADSMAASPKWQIINTIEGRRPSTFTVIAVLCSLQPQKGGGSVHWSQGNARIDLNIFVHKRGVYAACDLQRGITILMPRFCEINIESLTVKYYGDVQRQSQIRGTLR